MKQQMDPCKEEYTQWKLKNTESNSEFNKDHKKILQTLYEKFKNSKI